MNENNSIELNKAHEKDIENGGQGFHNEQGELDAVRNQEKTPDQIERMMSQDEIFTVVKENGTYTNMLAPCLSANIFLDGRILSYFTTPMKPIDLDDKVKDVMQLVLMEISKEQNGVVFKSDGSIDVSESIKQAALNGVQPIALLRDTMPEGMAVELAQKYYEMNKTGIEAAWAIDSNKGYKGIDEDHLNKILSFGIKNSRDAYKMYDNHDKYHKMFGDGHHSDEEKKDLTNKKSENDRRIKEKDVRIAEIKERLMKVQKGSKEYDSILKELQEVSLERCKYIKENDSIGSLEDSTMDDVEAKGLLASIRIMRKIGLYRDDYESTNSRLKDLNKNSKDVRKATRQEAANNDVERNYLCELSQRDAKQMQEYKDAIMSGNISNEDRQKYLLLAVKNYIVYSNIQQSKSENVINPEVVNINIQQALDGIVATVPSVKNGSQGIYWERIVQEVSQIPGYEHVTLDNIKHVFALEKGREIENEMQEIIKSAELDFLEHKEHDESEFVAEFKEADKELELVKYINYFKRLEEKGIENAALRMFKLKLEKEGMQSVLERAEATYEDSEMYTEEMMDNYKRGYAFSQYSKFQKLSPKEKRQMTKEDKGKIISSLIAAYDISRDETDISLTIQDAAKDVFGEFLGNVFDENGDIDDEKLFKAYKKTFPLGSKFALGKENENIDKFWNFHEEMTLGKVQNKVISNFMDTVKDRKKDIVKDNFITETEAQKAVDENGVVLDDSAITDPQKTIEAKPAQITRKEAEGVMERKGESMRVDDARVISTESKKIETPPVDKSREEEGNTVVAEEVNVGETAMTVRKENIFTKAWEFIKGKVSKIFGNSSSNNSDTSTNNNATGTGGIVQEDEKTKVGQQLQQNNEWAQPTTISVEKAQKDAKEAKDTKQIVEPDDPTI